MPVLDVTVAQVGRNVADLGGNGAELIGRREVIGEAHVSGAEAGGRIGAGRGAEALGGHLVDDRVDDVGTVVAEQVLAAEAVEVDEADAIGRADGGLGAEAVGEADAGSPIVAIGVDERTAVEVALFWPGSWSAR